MAVKVLKETTECVCVCVCECIDNVHKFPQNLGAISKFQSSEEWYEERSIRRTVNSAVSCETVI